MIARLGDRLIVRGTKVGDRRRVGVIVGLAHEDGTPPYRVRWESDGREVLVFPGPGFHLEPAPPEAAGNRAAAKTPAARAKPEKPAAPSQAAAKRASKPAAKKATGKAAAKKPAR